MFRFKLHALYEQREILERDVKLVGNPAYR